MGILWLASNFPLVFTNSQRYLNFISFSISTVYLNNSHVYNSDGGKGEKGVVERLKKRSMCKEDIKSKNKEKVDMIKILSRLVYFNTTEIFPPGAEL